MSAEVLRSTDDLVQVKREPRKVIVSREKRTTQGVHQVVRAEAGSLTPGPLRRFPNAYPLYSTSRASVQPIQRARLTPSTSPVGAMRRSWRGPIRRVTLVVEGGPMKQLMVISLVVLLAACRGGGDDGDADVDGGGDGVVVFIACEGDSAECSGQDGTEVSVSGNTTCEYVYDGHSYWAVSGSVSDGTTGVEFSRLEFSNDQNSESSVRGCDLFVITYNGVDYTTTDCDYNGNGTCSVLLRIDEYNTLYGRFMCEGIGEGLSTMFNGSTGYGTFEISDCSM